MEPSGARTALRASLALLLPLLCAAAVKEFHIAAVEIGWDYIHLDEADLTPEHRIFKDTPQKYIKAVYREYTDSTYTEPKQRAAWSGIQGPEIVAQAGDKVIIHFKNLASQPYSISPVGISYSKQSEGAGYDDSTAGQEKEDDAIAPGGYYEYRWDISHEDGPTASDPDCLTYTYSSQVDTVRDINSGLIGALLICKPSALKENGERRHPRFVLLFAVFDETQSWYGEVGERMSREKFKRTKGRKEYHTINGYINSTLPGLTMCQGRNPVFWHLIGVGTAPDIHSIRFQDHSLQVLSHRKITVEVTPMTFITAEMRPSTMGQFLISCQIHAHQHDGMEALFTVEKCPEPVTPPVPDLRKVKHKYKQNSDEEEEEEDYDYEHAFKTFNLRPNKQQVHARASRGQQSNTWEHYIAAEELTWNYTPHLTAADSEMHSRYLPTAPHHLDYTFKKVAYIEYTDGSFTQRKNPDNGLLGPTLKGKVNDQLHIVFRNLASRPFNIYPNGLTKIYPLHRSTNPAERDLRSMEVPPNGTFRYIWRLTTDDGPLDGDPTCLTHLYQSTISPERDLASGLVGTLLICKHNAIDMRGELLGPDKKLSLMFAVFDENRSWYFNENMQQSRQNASSISDPEFYDSNVIYSVNGIMFRKRQFVVCKSDVLFWHVANVGTQSDFLSVYFTGNLFQYDGLYQSVLTLFPMTGITVPMETEVIGEWEISAFDSSLKDRGMSIRYSVVPCNNVDLPLFDHDETVEFFDYVDDIGFQARGFGPRNRTVLVKVCKKVAANNTQPINSSGHNVTEDQRVCRLEKVTVPSVEPTDGGIPQDVLEGLEGEEEWAAPQNQSERGEHNGGRERRHAGGNWTDKDIASGASGDGEISGQIEEEVAGNSTDVEVREEEQSELRGAKNETLGAKSEPLGEKNETLGAKNETLGEKIETLGEKNETLGEKSEPLGEKSEPLGEKNETLGENSETLGAKNETLGEKIETLGEKNETLGENSETLGAKNETLGEKSEPLGEKNETLGAKNETLGEKIQTLGEKNETLGAKSEPLAVKNEILEEKNNTLGEQEENNEIPLNRESPPTMQVSTAGISTSGDMEQNSVTQNHIQPEPDRIMDELLDSNFTFSNESSTIDLSLEYDDYSGEENTTGIFATDYLDMRSGEVRPRHYYIAAEEIVWDYGVRTPHQLIKPKEMRRGMRKFLPKYKKVVFRAYMDKNFQHPVGRGELQKHLGILGPVIRTEVNDFLTVTFKNNALRPYSFHLQGIYDRNQDASFGQASSSSAPSGVPGEPVLPGETRTYNWRVTRKQGPTDSEFDCKTGAYYSTVDKEKDLHSGLIGPLVICKSGTLHSHLNTQPGVQDFSLLFHTFDETKSWYLEENLEQYCAPPCEVNTADPWYHTSNKFAAINGYVAETLPGLLLAQHQLVRWHLLNVASDKEYHAVHFHGLPFTVRTKEPHRMGVYSLFPGVFGTVEMRPPTVGTWLLECIIGNYQLAGMRAKLLVYNPRCTQPLGMKSGRIEDYQITASDFIENWEPSLARLEQSGYINAWMGKNKKSWLQVDLLKPTLLQGVLTQGVSSKLRNHYITLFKISYSLDKGTWTTYRGNSTTSFYNFHGNLDSSTVKENRLSPPIVARYIRICPLSFMQKPALRLELLGCDLNSCSLPLGLQRRLINDSSLTASSYYSNVMRSWSPSLARLHEKGGANAWRPKNNNPHEWLQVDLERMRRITGVITQGAQSLFTKLMVTEFSVTVSDDERSWSSVLEENSQREKIFIGNNNPDNEDEEVLTVFDPPLFGRFLRIHPRGWINGIALRLEVLGCDTQQVV